MPQHSIPPFTTEDIQMADEHTERGATSLATWKMPIKAHNTPLAIHQDDENQHNWYYQVLVKIWSNWNFCRLLGGNVKWLQPLWRSIWDLLLKLNICLPYGQQFYFQVYTQENAFICLPRAGKRMSVAALFVRAPNWKLPTCPPTME